MTTIAVTLSQLDAIDSGERVTVDGVSMGKYDSKCPTPVDLMFPEESIQMVRDGEPVIFADHEVVLDGADVDIPSDDDSRKTDDHSKRVDPADGKTRIEIDTSMLRQLATGSIELTIEVDAEEWDELAAGGAVSTEDLYLDYKQ